MAGGADFSVESQGTDRGVVIAVRGDLDLATVPELRKACEQAVEGGPGDVLLDLGGLTFLDSSGISVLVQAHHDLEARGRDLVLHRVDDRTRRVLEVAGLADFFKRSDQPAT